MLKNCIAVSSGALLNWAHFMIISSCDSMYLTSKLSRATNVLLAVLKDPATLDVQIHSVVFISSCINDRDSVTALPIYRNNVSVGTSNEILPIYCFSEPPQNSPFLPVIS